MGPGGAYGPPPSTGAPYPGQPVPIGMPKPGTVTGIQVILWVFAAISGLGDVFAVIGLAEHFGVFGILTLLVTVYFTVQSLISPVHIERGKRWAWIWSVVSAAIGLAGALVSIVLSLRVSQFFGGTVLLSLALGVLYGVLLGLLLSPSAKAWILMHRIQRGEVQAASAPGGPGAMGTPGTIGEEPQRPVHKPGVVTVVQVLLALLVVPVLLVLPELIEDFRHEAEVWDYPSLSAYMDTYSELWVALIAAGIGGLVALVVNALIIRGLGKGRRGARIFGAIWLGVTLVPMGIGALTMGMLIQQRDADRIQVDGMWMDDPFEPVWLPISFGALLAGTVLTIVAFILLMARGTRQWTPGKPPSIVIIQQPMR